MALPRRSAAGPSHAATGGVSSGYADVSELDKYKLVSNIGKGSFGVISKVQRVDDGREFALKQLDYSKMTEKDRKQILAEVAILESLKHRNIVQLVQKIKDPKNERIYIVMEYCTSGDLGSVIRKAQRSSQPIHEDKIWNIFLQITQALHHCHWPSDRPSQSTKTAAGRASVAAATAMADGTPRYQVLHRDLKPENVFLSDDFVKLGDFGLSKDMGTSAFTSTYVGTPLYMPPEILAENRYDTKSDIWSLGCLVFEMCALASPFSTAQTQAELITMVKSGKLPQLPALISPGLKNVIRAMLNLNPVKRPSTKDLLEMDEMKLHRKLFTVQNQASLLMTKKDEIRQMEERLAARAASLDERERTLASREAAIDARESSCIAKEEENSETQRRLNFAAEQLRGHWEKLRGEKENAGSDDTGLSLPSVTDGRQMPRRSLAVPSRPPLEERATLPIVAPNRFPRNTHPAYEDTPSKIPLAATIASPGPHDQIYRHFNTTPLRRNNTKSLGNLNSAYRADAVGVPVDATPAKQTLAFYRLKQRTSIGSPSELQAGGGGAYCEDVSMASPAYSNFASPAPFVPRSRRSSVAPNALLSHQASSASSIQGLHHGPSTDSILSSTTESCVTSNESNTATLPPTMIPAPTFVYREASTPAKWQMEDPDLPSPFLRRAPTAPAQMQHVPQPTTQVAHSTIPERQPLGSINVQPTISAPGAVAGGGAGAGGHKGKGATIPRSRSGTLHQHVLRTNAQQVARTSGDGQRSRTIAGR